MSQAGSRRLQDHELSADEVERRLRWARAEGHPRYVWPEVPIPAWRAGLEWVAGATRQVLSRSTDDPPATCSIGSVPPEAVGVAAFTSGMGPLLGWWIERGLLRTTPEIAELLALHLDQSRTRHARAERITATALDALADSEIPVTLLKGAYTAGRYFPEPGTRPVQDVDLVVATSDFRRAERALEAAGFRRTGGQRGPLRSDWLPAGERTHLASLSMTHAHNPLPLDLHAGFHRTLFGMCSIDLTPRAGETTPLPRLPGRVDAVDGALLALVVATHASEDLEGLQLLRLVELIFLARLSPEAPFRAPALARARALGALRFAYPALALADRLLPGTVEAPYLAAARADAPARMRRFVDGLTPATAQRVDHHTLTERFIAAKTPVDVARRMLHGIAPTSTGLSPRRLAEIYAERWFRWRKGRLGMSERP